MANYSLRKAETDRVFAYLLFKHLSRQGSLNVETTSKDLEGGKLKAMVNGEFYFNVTITNKDLVIAGGYKDDTYVFDEISLEDLSTLGFSITEGHMSIVDTDLDVKLMAIKAVITRNFVVGFNKYKQAKKEER